MNADMPIPVEMTVYEWHLLLSLIEATLTVRGTPQFNHGYKLYAKIANQLSKERVRVEVREPSSRR